jgi:hypothetical protein
MMMVSIHFAVRGDPAEVAEMAENTREAVVESLRLEKMFHDIDPLNDDVRFVGVSMAKMVKAPDEDF